MTGLGPEAPIVEDEYGGKQSFTGMDMTQFPRSLLHLGKIIFEGSKTHGKYNWKKIPIEEHLNRVLIHANAYLSENLEDDHVGHMACRALFALELILDKEHEDNGYAKEPEKVQGMDPENPQDILQCHQCHRTYFEEGTFIQKIGSSSWICNRCYPEKGIPQESSQ